MCACVVLIWNLRSESHEHDRKTTFASGRVFIVAFAGSVTPAMADSKPCCSYWSGEYVQSSPSTCRKYGGRVVSQDYCYGYYNDGYNNGYNNGHGYDNGYGYDRRRSGVSFSINLGDVVIGYSDGYYDRSRRWHRWRNDDERNWYRQNRRAAYFDMIRDRDNDRHRRDWRDGRRQDWRN